LREKEFSVDWFSQHVPLWNRILGGFRDEPGLKFLEIGSYEGRSAVWLLDSILTHPTSELVCIDSFDCVGLYDERYGFSTSGVEARLRRNLAAYGQKVRLFREHSRRLLASGEFEEDTFDFAYVDGSHRVDDVLIDGLLAWRLLRVGGVLVFDDYRFNLDANEFMRPRRGIDAFLSVYDGHLEVLTREAQVAVRKTRSSRAASPGGVG
jgi:predicted O-methyltransferase YrrM